MKQFTSEEIQAQFEKLPKQVQEAVTSSDVNEKIEAIANKHNLHIDQLSELVDEVGLVMLGLQKTSLFVDDLCSRLSIDRNTAQSISDDINKDIFGLIKEHLMAIENNNPTNTLTDLERLGDFTIDNTQTAENDTSPLGNMSNENTGFVEKRPEILDSIENPQPATRTYVSNTPNTRTEPLVDHLLTTPVVVPPQKIEQPPAINRPVPSTPIKRSGPDPYKEPIN